jgi:hypothetical protein
MTGSEWAAWVGAVTGVAALTWDIVRWSTEGPRLLVRNSPTIKLHPDSDPRPILAVWVTNTGTVTVTVTSLVVLEFKSWLARRRMRPARSWVIFHLEPALGPGLPRELAPGQQWMGGVRILPGSDIASAIAAGDLYVAIYHASAPTRPVLRRVVPPKETQEASTT